MSCDCTSSNDVYSGRTIFSSATVSMTTVKRIIRSSRQNLQSICATAFRPSITRMLEKRGVKIMEDSSVEIVTAHAIPPFPKSRPRNKVSLITARMTLCETSWVDLGVKVHPSQILPYIAGSWIGRLPRWLVDKTPFAGQATMVMSGLPFTKTQGTICGGKIDSIEGYILLNPNAGMVVGLLGYGDNLHLTLVTDEAIMTRGDADHLLLEVVEELHKMAEYPGSYKSPATNPIFDV